MDLGDKTDPVAGQSWAYGYDNIGNRKTAARDGDEDEYTANQLNQYTVRDVTGVAHVQGTAATNATVTVNNQSTTRYRAYFHKDLDVSNGSDPVWQEVKVVGVLDGDTNEIVAGVTGNVFVAETPESFTYDDDGNLLTDGRWTYTWNAENRLKEMETAAAAVSAGVPKEKLQFLYDYMGRRVFKGVLSSYTNGAYTAGEMWYFVYDGWSPVEELDAIVGGSTSTNLYAWGLDLSQSLQGAGGVGGLVGATLGTNSCLYAYDANGNVMQLVDAGDGSLKARYGRGPYGAVLLASGEYARDNPFGFSTTYVDVESGLAYYGYRYYSPGAGRWASRDPIWEWGGINLYGFAGNDGVGGFDVLGLLKTEFEFKTYKCQAFLYIGHAKNKNAIKWHVTECSIAGAVTCWPGPNNPKDPEVRWPMVPTHSYTLKEPGGKGSERFSDKAQLQTELETIGEGIREGDPRIERLISGGVNNALSRKATNEIMSRLCKKCCKTVEFNIAIGKDKRGQSWIKDAVAPFGYDELGKTYTFPVDCP